ncbi:C40 family peptidase [Aldersonia sp. NBC_00410]|uniref:C40 family peptidase n=1 Tax=Aldersonia sp. NBC_00410 TaxID=2975954 RepID=UPI002256F35F|nr:C40 family peptidase [Aldersonia sp. NBC_00410]MCX5045948.1 C40 family peptidase [Aldersonia sp. NBC_00410]
MAPHRIRRPVVGILATGLLGLGLAIGPSSAGADPVAIGSPSEAMQQLSDLSRQSEQTNEAVHQVQADLDGKMAALQAAQDQQARDQAALTEAKSRIAGLQPMIDRAAAASYRGARTNPLVSVLMSDSPQQVLDQMSAIDVISSETGAETTEYKNAIAAAAAAEDASRKSAEVAGKTADQARTDRDTLAGKRSSLDVEIGRVTEAWAKMSGPEQAAYAAQGVLSGFSVETLLRGLTPGSNTGALQAALTRVGAPYVWGATGPDSFDCSGLVVWAYKQIGKPLPRTSQAQASAGTPVGRDELQPGDIVTFYSDASHVGIYAGNGLVLHASTFGVPVGVSPMSQMPFHDARRV